MTMISIVCLFVLAAVADCHRIEVENKCGYTVWFGALGNGGKPTPVNGGFRLNSGQSRGFDVGRHWGGRFWGRTGCDQNGRSCVSGDCGRGTECGGAGGIPPATLSEITFDGHGDLDYYDVSLVDGFNVPMSMQPIEGTYSGGGGDQYFCKRADCDQDLNANCPQKLQVVRNGRVVACNSLCNALNTDRACCRGQFNNPQTCSPFPESRAFKAACPRAYSYAYDDTASTFKCKSRNGQESGYKIAFCPNGHSGGGGGGSSNINWQGNWAMHCDFYGNDFTKANPIPGEQCGGRCASTQGCTHFTWTNYEGGTCWMKRGPINKNQAVNKQDAVCGVV